MQVQQAVQPSADAPGSPSQRRSSAQWGGDANEGGGFPGRVPQHDAEDDYEELLQVRLA